MKKKNKDELNKIYSIEWMKEKINTNNIQHKQEDRLMASKIVTKLHPQDVEGLQPWVEVLDGDANTR